MGGMKLDVQELLDNYTVPEPNTGCLLWTGSLMKSGYGEITREGRRGLYVHRLVYEHFYGPIPKGMFICHHCDQRCCVEKTHLFLGTPADNIHDALSKGRMNTTAMRREGAAHHNARLTDDIVRWIRDRAAREGKGACTAIAHELGMSVANICLIVKRKAWAHVE